MFEQFKKVSTKIIKRSTAPHVSEQGLLDQPRESHARSPIRLARTDRLPVSGVVCAPRCGTRGDQHHPGGGAAARQVLRLAVSLVVASVLSVVVADSGYAKAPFLAACVGLTSLCVLVRLPCNRVLYGAPPPTVINPKTGKRAKKGRPSSMGPSSD
jgi:hypothetical protein